MIEIKDLTKSYEGPTVLNAISATYYDGKTNHIKAQTGSGKTV